MRRSSFLLILLLACDKASSTKSDSTIDVLALDKITNFAKSMMSDLTEKALYLKLLAEKNPVEKALTSLKLDKDRSTSRFDAWVNYAATTSPSLLSTTIEKVRTLYGAEGLTKMLKAFIANDKDDVVQKLESQLIASWKEDKKTTTEAFTQLGLDKPTDSPLRESLLKTWVKYGSKDESKAMVQMINSYDYDIRLGILEGMKKIEGPQHVIDIVSGDMTTFLEKLPVDDVFKLLKLDKFKQSDLHFHEWLKYAVKTPTLLSKETLKKLWEIHGEKGMLEVAGAYLKANRREDVVQMLYFVQNSDSEAGIYARDAKRRFNRIPA